MPAPVDRRLLTQARSTAPYLATCVVLGALGAACVLAQAALLAHAVTAVTVPLALVAVVAARALLVWGQETAAHRAAAGVKSQLRARVLERVTDGRPRPRSGEVTALVTRGIDALDPYFSGYLPQLVLSVIVPVTVLVALALTDLTAAVIVLVTLPLIPVFGALIGTYTAARTRRRWRTLELLAGHFTDVAAGLPTLKAFNRAGAQAATIAKVSDEHRRATMGTLRFAFLSALVLEIAGTVSVALVAVSVGLRLVSGSLTLETALFVLILAPEAYLPLRTAAARFHAAEEGVAATEKIFTLLDDEPDPGSAPGHEGAQERQGAQEHDSVRRCGGVSGRGSLGVEGLVVAHEGREAVGPFSLTLEDGALTALAGPSGAGKSSLVGVLMGFVRAESGSVRTLERERIAWVPQRPFFFAGTVAENIAVAVPGASEDAVRRAAEALGVPAFTPLDAPLGERGAGLSAGQLQRVALARAALRCDLLDTPLVLLDEPTAHLDAETEIAVTEAIATLARGRTALVVTHRRALLERADRVVTLGPERAAVTL